MIKLRFKTNFFNITATFTGKILSKKEIQSDNHKGNEDYLIESIYDDKNKKYLCKCKYGNFEIFSDNYCLFGDIFIFFPKKNYAMRLIRRSSKHNTILFTEKCDQLCVMCSQPPRDIDSSWLFPFYEKAIQLSDKNTRIGISGGEPTLYKKELFSLLLNTSEKREDISFHILSNAQHFNDDDLDLLNEINKKVNILWGIPLYSDNEDLHNKIVKKNAFHKLLDNLFLMAEAGSSIELRTVLMLSNYQNIPFLSKFISRNLDFISIWAIMSLEQIGFAKVTKEEIFIDHTQFLKPLIDSIEIAKLNQINVQLYNFPYCTIPKNYQEFCQNSISDWKKKFIDDCNPCTKKSICTGFFEWYNNEWKFNGIRPYL